MQHDAKTISECRRGSPEAYRTLVEGAAPAVRAFLLRRLGGLDAAEEAAQEAFVRAFAGLGRLRGSFTSWVLGIAAHVAAEGRRRPSPGAQGLESAAGPPAPARHDASVSEAAQALPEPYREAVLLRYWGGLSCDDVAAAQGVSLGTLTKRLSRAHQMLRERLDGARGQAGERKEVDDAVR